MANGQNKSAPISNPYFETLNRELKRVHLIVHSPKSDETTRATALLQLSNLHRNFYRNTLKDYGLDADELRANAPVIDIRGTTVKKA
jgi:crotonobetainyl-CoA:carnitine CoA-transferase CaiB-like acyl-CoA transferase